MAGWIWLERYLFCSDEPDYIETVFFALIAAWVVTASTVGYLSVRGHKVWPWTLAWFALSTAAFALVVYTAREPVNCGLF